MTLTPTTVPDGAHPEATVEVSYTIELTGGTYEDIDETGVRWDTSSHGTPLELANYPNSSNTLGGNEGGEYTVDFTAPAQVGHVYLVIYARSGLTTFFAAEEYHIKVFGDPYVRFGGTQGWNLVGHNHTVRVYVHNVTEGDELEASIYWDTVSHRNGAYDKADYPNRTEVFGYDEAAAAAFALDINVTLPESPSVVFIMAHALVNGVDHYDPLERGISVVGLPDFNTTLFPGASLPGADVNLTWYIPNMAGNYVQGTLVLWDEESHSGEAFDVGDWPSSSAELPGNNSRTYETTVTVPDEETTLYMVVAVRVRDEWFVSAEHQLRVMVEPSIVVDAPGSGYAGTSPSIWWEIVNATEGDVDLTGIRYGTLQGGPYEHGSEWNPAIGLEFDASVDLPTDAERVYYQVYATVHGWEISAPESFVVVEPPPLLALVSAPDEVFGGTVATVRWTVQIDNMSEFEQTRLRWDTMSHSPSTNPGDYPHSSELGMYDGSEFQGGILTPEGPGVLYLTIYARLNGTDFFNGTEHTIALRAYPSLSGIYGTTRTMTGDDIAVSATLENATWDEVTSLTVFWDTTDHPTGNPDMYPNTANLTHQGDGVFQATFKAPSEKGNVYWVLRLTVGDAVVTTEERTVTVTEEEGSPGPGAALALASMGLVALAAAARRRR